MEFFESQIFLSTLRFSYEIIFLYTIIFEVMLLNKYTEIQQFNVRKTPVPNID